MTVGASAADADTRALNNRGRAAIFGSNGCTPPTNLVNAVFRNPGFATIATAFSVVVGSPVCGSVSARYSPEKKSRDAAAFTPIGVNWMVTANTPFSPLTRRTRPYDCPFGAGRCSTWTSMAERFAFAAVAAALMDRAVGRSSRSRFVGGYLSTITNP